MDPDQAFRALVEAVGRFHLTAPEIGTAQREIEAVLANGAPDAAARARYLRAVRRYFRPFNDEARAHLRDVDRRLEHAAQVQFNLSAERAVAVKRIEATGEVLAVLDRLESEPA